MIDKQQNPDFTTLFPDSGKPYMELPRDKVLASEKDFSGSIGRGIAKEAVQIWQDTSLSPAERLRQMDELMGKRLEEASQAGYNKDTMEKIKVAAKTELQTKVPNIDQLVAQNKSRSPEAKPQGVEAENPALAQEIRELFAQGLGQALLQLELVTENDQTQVKPNAEFLRALQELNAQKDNIPPGSPQLELVLQHIQPLLEQSRAEFAQQQQDLAEIQSLQTKGSAISENERRRLDVLNARNMGNIFSADYQTRAEAQRNKFQRGLPPDPEMIRKFNRTMVDGLVARLAQKQMV